jgi:tagatose 1,6-diphosphate aldolase
VVKVEFPLDVHDEPDQGVWGEACAELDAASRVPWTLLSAGDAFETFKQQLRVACRAGCSGFVGGRAIWQEAVELGDKERAEFLDKVAYHRVCELREIAAQYATPWHRRLSAAHVDEDWFQEY